MHHPTATDPQAPVLVAGGDADINLASLLRRLAARDVPHRAVLVGAEGNPSISWDLADDVLTIDGEPVRACGAFIRHDVFTHMADPRHATAQRAGAWHATVQGWLWAHPAVRLLNRTSGRLMNKPYHLMLARQAGLEIPRTLVSNDTARLHARAGDGPMVVKPVGGGGYCEPLEAMLAAAPVRDERTAAPAIVQNRLEQPEVRIYHVGGRFLPFRVHSEVLDYRASGETRVEALPPDAVAAELVEGLGRVMEMLQMDFGAADFKTDPQTGRLVFLELNSSPMFAAFDAVSDDAVSDAIIDFCTGARAA
ncbi:MAG TPA: hypothetical protein VFH27_16025 [Longimicrobiaceae bacterium]|nr:hypothetical protein [Longimicrobiaceae bacterium]